MTDETDSDNRYLKAKIISTGNLVEGLKDGDVVYYDKHAGHDISYKERQNYTLTHFTLRLNIYNEEEFNYEIDKVKLK